MRRTDKEITNRREIETILSKATIARIGLIDRNIPYIVPLNFGYKNNCLYFHSAPIGKKIELITRNNMVCFEVDIDHEIIDSGIPCKWSSKYASVIGYGKASFITDSAQKKDALNIIIDHYSPGTSYNFPEKNLHEIAIIKIEITQMTGKKSR
ncbi:MAG: pyridoxamine 5'-phosphate oxidase family protein [Thermoplasmata archaeon]|nr:pyridoxamine 5'-phosphate oxidase family protein [Thermoplasmata archaeon]